MKVSFITQLEILSFSNLTKSSEKLINELLSECVIIDINNEIKRSAIELRKNYKLKLPDCLMAATAASPTPPCNTNASPKTGHSCLLKNINY